MPSLEQIVRPFIVLDTTPPRLAPPASGTTNPGPTVVKIGMGGSGKTVSTSSSASVTTYMDGKQKEKAHQ